MNEQRVDKTHLQLHFVNRFKEIDTPKSGLKRPREEASENGFTYKNAFEQSQRASTSRPHSVSHSGNSQDPSNGSYYQRKRARTDISSNGFSNGHHSAARHENGHPDGHWPPIGLPSSSKVHMDSASAAQEKNDQPHRFRNLKLKAPPPHLRGESSPPPKSLRFKREPEEFDSQINGKLKVKEEPCEHTLFHNDSGQSVFDTSVYRTNTIATASSEDPSANTISNAVNAAVTSVQEDQMDSALVESAIQAVQSTCPQAIQSTYPQANVATTSTPLPSAASTNDTAAEASAASERSHGMGSIKTEETLELYNAIRQEFHLSDIPNLQTSQAQDNQDTLDQQDTIQEALRQAAIYSTLLNTNAEPSLSATLEGTMLQPYQNGEPANNLQTASTSILPHVQQPSENDQIPTTLSLSAQLANHQVQNVNPRLISPLPQRALRSCMVTEEQRQREKRRVSFNALVENDYGETWQFEG